MVIVTKTVQVWEALSVLLLTVLKRLIYPQLFQPRPLLRRKPGITSHASQAITPPGTSPELSCVPFFVPQELRSIHRALSSQGLIGSQFQGVYVVAWRDRVA